MSLKTRLSRNTALVAMAATMLILGKARGNVVGNWIDANVGPWNDSANWTSDPAVPSQPGDEATMSGGLASITSTIQLDNLTINNADATPAEVQMSTGMGKYLQVNTLSFSGASTLDITDNVMIIENMAESTVGGLIQSGQISSSETPNPAPTPPYPAGQYGIGYASGAELAADYPGDVYFGIQLQPNWVVVRFTLLGDTNLDGIVNATDFSQLASHENTPGDWFDGDFNGDGIVNSADFSELAANYGKGIPTNLGPINMPEPTGSVAVILLGGGAAMIRKRERKVDGN